MLVQVCLESLPISSSGHTSLLLFYDTYFHEIASCDQLKYFDWFLHGITCIVITVFFWNAWWQLILHKKFHVKYILDWNFWKKLALAGMFVTVSTLVFFTLYILQSFVWKAFVRIPLFLGFCITALELLYMNYLLCYKKNSCVVSWNLWHALILGISNAVLVHIPGVSRFGTNFLLCQIFGYKPAEAFAVSWLIFIPFAFAGGLYGVIKVASDSYLLDQVLRMPMLLGMVIAGVISYILLYWCAYMIDHKKLSYVALYMIIPIVLSLGLLF